MKKIILLSLLFASLNSFSQNYNDTLFDSIRNIVFSDLGTEFEKIEPFSSIDINDTNNIEDYRETLMISFGSKEYSEIKTYYIGKEDGLKENITKVKTAQKLKQIDKALSRENKILYDLFDCFIYKFRISYINKSGWNIEYKIKADDKEMRIIERKIDIMN